MIRTRSIYKFILPHPILLLIIGIFLLSACQPKERTYIIGVSQCNADAWRSKMNLELNHEQILHPELQLRFRHANADNAIQCLQIDSFIKEGVDLLIICPNEANELEPAIIKAFHSHTPIILADRNISGKEYTAFVGGDNKEVGYNIGRWLKSLHQKYYTPSDPYGTLYVLELTGLEGSSPMKLRHQGMMETIRQDKHIRFVAQASGRWQSSDAEQLTDSLLFLYPEINAIVAQNDLMALGAARACRRHDREIPIIGVDGLTGLGGGIEAVENQIISNTITYSSRGDIVLQRAAQILHGESFPRNTILKSILVGQDEATALQLLADEQNNRLQVIQALQERIYDLNDHLHIQTLLSYSLIILLLFFLGLCGIIWNYYTFRYRVHREREEHEALVQKQQEKLDQMTEQLKQVKIAQSEDEVFLEALQKEIETHLDDPNLGVEMLSTRMNMSRTILYRKTKNVVGCSPIDLIHHIRLYKAQELLRKSNLTVQQVGYTVGFSTPGYFAKLYRAEFGISPGEEQKRQN